MLRKKLVVISHTEHYKGQDGLIKGWGSTVNEINYLADYWEEIVHVACLYKETPPSSALPYTHAAVKFMPLPPYGGKKLGDKLGILLKIPKISSQVIKSLKGATEIQLRLPTSMGVFLLPLFSFFLPRKYTLWVKYAGNWSQQAPPLSYRLQRWWLKKNAAKCKVTINGFWPNQPKNCYSFENPCLTEEDLVSGTAIAEQKVFKGSYTFAFVGRLEEAKGVSRIVEAFKAIPLEKINKIHFVGDGLQMDYYKEITSFLGDKVVFHGFLGKKDTHAVVAQAHFFLLPSDSEGFPKVIAEAACYGAIPVVSDVGSISHYINSSNGFVWKINQAITFSEVLKTAVHTPPATLQEMAQNGTAVAQLFTFNQYKNKLERLIFNKA